jgi:hypothetical protein
MDYADWMALFGFLFVGSVSWLHGLCVGWKAGQEKLIREMRSGTKPR